MVFRSYWVCGLTLKKPLNMDSKAMAGGIEVV